MNAIDEFMSKVEKKGPDECWNWIGVMSANGYGRYRFDRVQYLAHRFSYMIHVEAFIPHGMMICHRCDNPGCVNPAHLFCGSAKDNMQDAARKGRLYGSRTLQELRLDSIPVIRSLPVESNVISVIGLLPGESNVIPVIKSLPGESNVIPGYRRMNWSAKPWSRMVHALAAAGAVRVIRNVGVFVNEKYRNVDGLIRAIESGELEVTA